MGTGSAAPAADGAVRAAGGGAFGWAGACGTEEKGESVVSAAWQLPGSSQHEHAWFASAAVVSGRADVPMDRGAECAAMVRAAAGMNPGRGVLATPGRIAAAEGVPQEQARAHTPRARTISSARRTARVSAWCRASPSRIDASRLLANRPEATAPACVARRAAVTS